MTTRPRVRVVIAFRGLRSRLARALTGSIAVHGALLAAVLVVPATRHRVAPIDDKMVVALAGPLAVAAAPRAAAPPSDAVKPAPAPAPPPAPKEAHAVREVPVPKPKDKPVKPHNPAATRNDSHTALPASAVAAPRST